MKEDKDSILDIKAITDNGSLIDIEIQLLGNSNYSNRSLYYWAFRRRDKEVVRLKNLLLVKIRFY